MSASFKNNQFSLFFWICSVIYALGQILLGLLVHPYQTMQMLVEGKVFVWMSIAPTFLLATATLFWRAGLEELVGRLVHPLFGLISLQDTFWETLSVFMGNWFVFYMLFWQVLLLYLLFRFSSIEKVSI